MGWVTIKLWFCLITGDNWFHFPPSTLTVLPHVRAATHLRLVNGLLIIEDRHPLEISSGSSIGGSGSSSSSSNHNRNSVNENAPVFGGNFVPRSSLREAQNNDLHGHGYLNRNRSHSLRSSRRLLKDGQQISTTTTTTTTTTVQSNFIAKIIPPPTIEATRDAPVESSVASHVKTTSGEL